VTWVTCVSELEGACCNQDMGTRLDFSTLPAAWQDAFRRDAQFATPQLADPRPERRLAQLLGAFIGAGLFFLVLPGTLIGVWNLIRISSQRDAAAISTSWIQAHGHAQLFGWVGSFMIGISLHTVAKFRGTRIRSLAAGWTMCALWTAAVGVRWLAGVADWRDPFSMPVAAAIELTVALALLWQISAPPATPRPREAGIDLIFTGLAGLALALAYQFALVLQLGGSPVIPAQSDSLLIHLALWIFCFPVVWGFSARFLPTFLGSRKPGRATVFVGIASLAAGAVGAIAGWVAGAGAGTFAAVLIACWSLGVFRPGERPPKTAGVDPRYPAFVRLAFGWLVVSALLTFGAASPGMTGASRHAFTVGFLATMILAIGPRILPAFLSSRELWSRGLMLAALVLLTCGCALRVSMEPVAYAGAAAWAWRLLPVSAYIELSAVLVFAYNIARTLASPVPSWFGREQVKDSMMLYWYVASYPATRRLLIDEGLKTLARVRQAPQSLTLREAAEADGVDPARLVAKLGDFFEARLVRSARK
jgi:uncharacterized protein involved in response to NO